MAKGAVVARIVSEYSDKGTRAATKDFKKLSGDTEGVASKISGTFKKIAAAAAVIEIAHIGIDAIKAAEVVNGAFAKMTTAFANTGSSLNQFSPQVQETVDKMGNLAFTAGDTADALARGAISFHSATTALGNMSLAADLARTTGMTLSDAMVILGKAAQGKTVKALTALGVVMPKTGSAAEKFKSVTDQLTASLKGQADAYAQTHPIEVMKTKMEEMSSSIGQLLMPAFNKVVSFISNEIIPTILKFVNFLRANPQYLQPFLDVFAQIITTLAKVGGVVIDLLAVFAKMDSVILQVVRGMAWITGNKEMANWAKKAADGMGELSSSLANAGKKMLTYVMHSTKLHSVAPITIKALSNIKTATDSSAAATSKLTAEQLKSLAALKALGVTPTTSTDPIELEAARLNLVKQRNTAASDEFDAMMKNLYAQSEVNTATQRYSDILGVLSDQTISTSEIEVLAKKWGIPTESVIAYIAKATGANNIPGLDSPANVAKLGWEKALTALDAYLAALRGMSTGAAAVVGGPNVVSASPQTDAAGTTYTGGTLLSSGAIAGATDSQGNPVFIPAPGAPTISGLGTFGSTPFPAASGTSGGAAPVVNVTVMGSVVTQADLVAGVANGLMQSQLSGTNYTVNMLNL